MWFKRKPKIEERFPPYRWSHDTAVQLPWTAGDAEEFRGAFQFARHWLAALEAGNYKEALEMTYPHETDQGILGIEWLRAMISNYGSLTQHRSGVMYHVTSPRDASGFHDKRKSLQPDPDDVEGRAACDPEFPIDVYFFDEPPEQDPLRIGYLNVGLPLNGAWSDVAATFDILRRGDSMVFRLIAVEVM